jgi:hypothetical protein
VSSSRKGSGWKHYLCSRNSLGQKSKKKYRYEALGKNEKMVVVI